MRHAIKLGMSESKSFLTAGYERGSIDERTATLPTAKYNHSNKTNCHATSPFKESVGVIAVFVSCVSRV
jgi:hypothetical protein